MGACALVTNLNQKKMGYLCWTISNKFTKQETWIEEETFWLGFYKEIQKSRVVMSYLEFLICFWSVYIIDKT